MTEIPMEQEGEYTPDKIEFWLEEARLLEETAALSWSADMSTHDQEKLLYSPLHDQLLSHATEELGVELNLLYLYLISLAIQYLAIGILIDRDPHYFMHHQPGHRVLKLVEACDVVPTPLQRRLLKELENAYDWAERYPLSTQGEGHEALRRMTQGLSEMACLNSDEKGALDGLYAALRREAIGRIA
jgi:hypothetical protein